jgi:hypothetical protein
MSRLNINRLAFFFPAFLALLALFGACLISATALETPSFLPELPTTHLQQNQPYNVTYNHRSLIINGEPTLLLVGSIHYPRSSPGTWSAILERTKAAGVNAIDTYVFWDMHEPNEGEFDFESGT